MMTLRRGARQTDAIANVAGIKMGVAEAARWTDAVTTFRPGALVPRARALLRLFVSAEARTSVR